MCKMKSERFNNRLEILGPQITDSFTASKMEGADNKTIEMGLKGPESLEVKIERDADAKIENASEVFESPEKLRIYLIDVSPHSGGGSGASTLQRVIEKETPETTMIYCFAGMEPPKISLSLLQLYSTWLNLGRLNIIQPPGKAVGTSKAAAAVSSAAGYDGGSTTHTLAFTVGQLVHLYKPEETKIFIASEDFNLFNVVLCLRQGGFEVESSWPDPESVQCNDDILFTVVSQIQSLQTLQPEISLPRTIDGFRQFLRTQCQLPPYISLESVMRAMQEKGMISFHKGMAHYDPPVMLSVESVQFAGDDTPYEPYASLYQQQLQHLQTGARPDRRSRRSEKRK